MIKYDNQGRLTFTHDDLIDLLYNDQKSYNGEILFRHIKAKAEEYLMAYNKLIRFLQELFRKKPTTRVRLT